MRDYEEELEMLEVRIEELERKDNHTANALLALAIVVAVLTVKVVLL